MARRNSILKSTTAGQLLSHRVAFALFFLLSLSFLFMAKSQEQVVSRLRMAAIQQLAPVVTVIARPAAALNHAIARVREFLNTYEDNQRLRGENARLKQWHAAALNMERVNQQLRNQLNLKVEAQPVFVTARVIADTGGPFVRTLLLRAGQKDGVHPGQAATNGDGLVGRVIETAPDVSRLLLITDLNARIPITVEGSSARGIMAGDNSPLPRLLYLPDGTRLKPGGRVITSGHAGYFPPGIPIGKLVQTGEGEFRVRPFALKDDMEYLTVLDYRLPGMERATTLAIPGG